MLDLLSATKDKYKICHFTERETIQKIIDWAPYVVGHNILKYDIPILERHGINFSRNQIVWW